MRFAFKYLPFNLPFLSDGVVFFQRSWPPFQYKHDYFFLLSSLFRSSFFFKGSRHLVMSYMDICTYRE